MNGHDRDYQGQAQQYHPLSYRARYLVDECSPILVAVSEFDRFVHPTACARVAQPTAVGRTLRTLVDSVIPEQQREVADC